jgi:small-conductance mechanosensitive channel
MVLTMLEELLGQQRELLSQPAPHVFFSGFGESSLDFVLRAWVADNDEWVRIRSDVALAVNRALTDRGIEIPFPQRDLHVRSVSPDIRPGAVLPDPAKAMPEGRR